MQERRKDVLDISYDLIEVFLIKLSDKDYSCLGSVFGLSDAVIAELVGYMSDYFDGADFGLSPPPKDVAFVHRGSRTPFSVYGGENEEICWRIECLLWEGGREEEVTLCFDLFCEDGKYRLQYLCSGS